MDDYPAQNLDHNCPFLVTLGLPRSSKEEPTLEPDLREGAVLLRSGLSPVEGSQAEAFLRYIEGVDASGVAGNKRNNTQKYKFRIRAASQAYLLPPRRARLPENFEEAPKSPTALHSPFSPLSPSCSLYPDGIINANWLRKHQELVPSIFLCFYSLTSDPSLATLHDNKIKTDITSIRSAIHQSGYKSRLSVVILADESAPTVEGAQERLDNIRKGCGLDPKTFFFVPSQVSQEELERVADNALATVYTQAVEYYRDLGRHSRKKRGRGFAPQPTVPPTSGTSQTLSLPGWNARYDFKSAIFAEFRQEMDIALRSFEQAYETLLGSDVLEAIPSWSPRWNEARLLADTIAIRSLRCLLWNGQHSTAVRRWQSHRDRMCNVIDRRGRGTHNYGWMAWEARWAVVMANLLERVGVPELEPESTALFLQPEKGVIGERLPPWELLHHTGYWYLTAARHLFSRRALAYAIPEDDRRPPDFSPASKVASRAFTYDTYMCPEPHEEYPIAGREGIDHSKMIVGYLLTARTEFQKRQQLRLAGEVALECSREMLVAKAWRNIFDLLFPLWHNAQFRFEGWTHIIEDLSWTLRRASENLGRPDVVVAIDWELLDRRYTKRQNWHYDMAQALHGMSLDDGPLTVKLGPESIPSFLSTSFVFKADEGKAGETCQAQLAITSNAFPGSPPVVLEAISIGFEGNIKPVVIGHVPAAGGIDQNRGSVSFSFVSLEEESGPDDALSTLNGTTELSLRPGSTLVLEMAIYLREPGDAQASSMKLSLACESFSLEQIAEFSDSNSGNFWMLSPTSKKPISRTNPHFVHILPRPPKMEIQLLNLLSQYYTNEPFDIQFSLVNAEESDAGVQLDAIMFGEEPQVFKLLVAGEEIDTAASQGEEAALMGVPLGVIGSTKSIQATMQVPAGTVSSSYEFTLRASYRLVTDPATPIVQTLSFKINLVNPFEANYDLLPLVHRAPWPSLFDYEAVLDYGTGEDAKRARGLHQAWSLVTRYASFASDDLQVKDVSIAITPTHGVRCHPTRRSDLPAEGVLIKPKTIEEAHFDIDTQRLSLDDRDPVSLDSSFLIKWQRLNVPSPTINTTTLPVPRLGIFGTEPRVLASFSYSNDALSLIFLDIHIENASNHFLTFGLTMEPSDQFAFSGSKSTTLHLLPVSRRSVTYRLLPLVRGAWIKPGLTVRDKYFQKVLRIIPTEGMKLDKEGFLVWVPPEDD